MTEKTGSYGLESLLAVTYASAADYGFDKINDELKGSLNYWNGIVNESLSMFTAPVTVQAMAMGVDSINYMEEVDEYGTPTGRKNLPTESIAFPLRMYKSGAYFTSKWLEIATPAEVASKQLAAIRGDQYNINRQLKEFLLNNDNITFVDRLTNGVSLAVKKFWNADSAVIPNSPGGVAFAGASHTHYIARAAGLASTDVDSLVEKVTEHGNTRGVKVFVSLSDVAAIKALTTKFIGLGDGGLVYNVTDSTVAKLNFGDLENQLIGYWGNSSVEVWTKPWCQQYYYVCMATEMAEKPLGYRQRSQPNLRGLRLAAENKEYPILANFYEHEFGFGALNRGAGAVLYTGDTSWADASITDPLA